MTDPTVMFFDQYQRYHTAADMIHKSGGFADASPQCAEGCGNAEGTMRGEIAYPLRILEVGANEHRDLGKFLPDADIFYTDLHLPESMEGDDHCFTADATDLQAAGIADNSYDFCVALDVFEHIPQERRKPFLTELYRVCKTAAIISFPYNTPENAQAELEVNEMYRELFGEDHPWLIEHMENGLPDRAFADSVLTEAGIPFTAFTHGSVAVWKRMLVLNYFADEDAFSGLVTDTNLYYNRNLYARDTVSVAGTDYRVFFILEKAPEIKGTVRNPFEGQHLSDADIAPIDDALNRIAG